MTKRYFIFTYSALHDEVCSSMGEIGWARDGVPSEKEMRDAVAGQHVVNGVGSHSITINACAEVSKERYEEFMSEISL